MRLIRKLLLLCLCSTVAQQIGDISAPPLRIITTKQDNSYVQRLNTTQRIYLTQANSPPFIVNRNALIYPSNYATFRFLNPATQAAGGAACELPQQIGTGPYRIPRWYFNPLRSRCELFYWSGCCGNGNNFRTFQHCQQICEEQPQPCANMPSLRPLPCSPSASSCNADQFCHIGQTAATTVCCNKPAGGVSQCEQALNVGVGGAHLARWFFNSATQQCQQFVYSGLQGNENNFLTREQCERTCQVNPCSLGLPYQVQGIVLQCSVGNPSVCPGGYYCHFGADSRTTVCCPSAGGDPCGQPVLQGQGNGRLQRWYWNGQSQYCLPFVYFGMKGSQNNFLTKKDCEDMCYLFTNPCAGGQPQLDIENRPIKCGLSPAICGPSFWCHHGATPQTTVCCPNRVDGPAICQLPLVVGTGNAVLQRFYYDSTNRKCMPFFYKGTSGNQNSFATMQECEQACPTYVNVCPVGGPLIGSNNRPLLCTFGSGICGPSHFCHLGLVAEECQCCQGAPTNPAACQGVPYTAGVSGASLPPTTRWYYDAAQRTCKTFQFNGRGGNQNNFYTEADCAATCDVFVNPCSLPVTFPIKTCTAVSTSCGAGSFCHLGLSPKTSICCPSEGNPCTLPRKEGTGSGAVNRWWYNSLTSQCETFVYRGMKGNDNNFVTKEQCERRCEPNPCFQGKPLTGSNGKPQLCSAYAQFSTCPPGYWCHVGADKTTTVCCPGAQSSICTQRLSAGEGPSSLDRFFFDSSSKKCRPFIYKGLKGNQNNFLTLRNCQLQCQPIDNPCVGNPAVTASGQTVFCSATNKAACPVNYWCHLGATPETTVCCPGATNPCSVPLAPGTGNAGLARYYYNADSRQCLPFEYNGMRGNQNNFLSQQECSKVCPEQLCLLSIDIGACGDRQTRFAFNREANKCTPFEYTGCGGNLNNFKTLEDCISVCGNVGF